MTDTTDKEGQKENSKFMWRRDPEFSDWMLEIVSIDDGEKEVVQTYCVHRNVMGFGDRSSKYFAKQFRHAKNGNCAEAKSQKSKIELPTQAASVVPVLLDYIYCTDFKVEKIEDVETLVALHFLGDYFDIDSLRIESKDRINRILSISKAHDICSHAERFVDDEILCLVAKFVSMNLWSVDRYHKLITDHGFNFWMKVADVLDPESMKNIGTRHHWSIIVFSLTMHHRESLTYEVFARLTTISSLPCICPTVALKLLEVETKLANNKKTNDIDPHGKIDSIQDRCSKALVSSWQKIPFISDVSRLLSEAPRENEFVIDLLLKTIKMAQATEKKSLAQLQAQLKSKNNEIRDLRAQLSIYEQW
eukprot:CAMPEP_0113473900 /NCGR_PEP_ID=MMETSP0014_2-20120614/18293_1 /TAXON_ID=2857 /ORGANISM="Nitzschia sp." /LENGTH=361 /DNA_ID=CAMNT_0000366703 /DNA_START=131 /DNA_END=1216 /DNA_ORIENTATION=+ /assembly_acc=CAM_ASM_000159